VPLNVAVFRSILYMKRAVQCCVFVHSSPSRKASVCMFGIGWCVPSSEYGGECVPFLGVPTLVLVSCSIAPLWLGRWGVVKREVFVVFSGVS